MVSLSGVVVDLYARIQFVLLYRRRVSSVTADRLCVSDLSYW